jgi:replication factor C large subunit
MMNAAEEIEEAGETPEEELPFDIDGIESEAEAEEIETVEEEIPEEEKEEKPKKKTDKKVSLFSF